MAKLFSVGAPAVVAFGQDPLHKLPLDMLPEAMRGGSIAKDMFVDEFQGETSFTSKTLQVPLDHFNSSEARSFDIHYFTDSQYFDSSSGPIFITMGGEGPTRGVRCNSHAQKFGALCVAYEHRYYGVSLPAGGLANKNMPFLSVEQNLADVALLVDTLREEVGDSNRAVFNFGGSYSGATCAWFRTRYPEKSSGCISESGVVNAILDFTAMDTHVYDVMHGYAPSCASALLESTKAMERLFEQGRADYVKSVFNAAALNNPTTGDADFWYMIADQSLMMVQYGSKVSLCEGLAELPSNPSDEERLDNLNTILTAHFGKNFASDCFYDSAAAQSESCAMRSWRWQKCAELAYLQPAPAENSLRASNLTLEALIYQCQYIFPGYAPAKPATDEFNQRFGGATPALDGSLASNIVFLDYSDDPWMEASPMKENPGMPYCLTTCDGCGHCGAGVPLSKGKHCQDVASQYMEEWLSATTTTV